jgi:hypothetical protein
LRLADGEDGLVELPTKIVNIKALTKKALKSVFDGFKGLVEPSLFSITYKTLTNAVDVGFGKVAYKKANPEFITQLKQSGAWFAGQKTYQQQKDLAALLVSSDGKTKRPWKEFEKAASGIVENYNERWLRVEYNTAIRSARVVSQWAEWQANEHLYPNLKYLPSRAATPREEHKPYYGVVRPIDDDFWVKHLPPSAYNCLCGVEPTDEAVTDVPEAGPKPTPGLDNNPAVSGELFNNDTHPYADGIDAKTKEQIREEAEQLARQEAYKVLNQESKFIRYVKQTEKFRSDYPDHTPEELASIYGYSQTEHTNVNPFLLGKRKATPFLQAYSKVLTDALKKLPIKKGVVYRTGDFSASTIADYKSFFKSGKPMLHPFFVSTYGKIQKVVKMNVMIKLTQKSGRSIEALSHYGASEAEILLPAGSQWQILDFKQVGDLVTITAKEL